MLLRSSILTRIRRENPPIPLKRKMSTSDQLPDQKRFKQPDVDTANGSHVKDMKQDTLALVLQCSALTDGAQLMFCCKELSKRWSAQFLFVLVCLKRQRATFTVRHKVMCYAAHVGGSWSPPGYQPVSNVTMEREGVFGPFSFDKAKQVAAKIKNATERSPWNGVENNAWSNAWRSDNNDGYTRVFEEGDDYICGQNEAILVETASEARPESDIDQWVVELGGWQDGVPEEEQVEYDFTYVGK